MSLPTDPWSDEPAEPPATITLQDPSLPPISHDIMLRALRGESTPRAPAWAMRQAGRYLPEFRALRAKSEFFEVRAHGSRLSLAVSPL
jgi:hypothetical protein